MNRIIFLDIDGVLNAHNSKRYMPAPDMPEILYVGIDEDKLLNLKHIVDATNAEIYLTSTWKTYWEKEDKSKQDDFANEIDKRFAAVGLKVTDKTDDIIWKHRAAGVHKVLTERHPDAWVILDDEIYPDFPDYAEEIFPHLVQTFWYGHGLDVRKTEAAIRVLNGELMTDNDATYVSLIHHGKK